jgi:prepilin-type N-terminal cleavage/methylation domain-containing protein
MTLFMFPRPDEMRSERVRSQRSLGFSLLEIAIALVILAILSSSLLNLIVIQVELRRQEESRRILENVREAILGFSAAHGRLPCPASKSSRGLESFCRLETGTCSGSATTDVQTHGNCSNFYDGFVPAASLGLYPLDEDGFLRDAWGEAANRVRYAVHDLRINSIPHVLTGTDRIRKVSMSAVIGTGTPVTHLYVCGSVATSSPTSSCGTGPNSSLLASNIPMVVFSLGPNGALETSGKSADEGENLDGDRVFVSRTRVKGPSEFDDSVTWISLTVLFERLMRAGRLP